MLCFLPDWLENETIMDLSLYLEDMDAVRELMPGWFHHTTTIFCKQILHRRPLTKPSMDESRFVVRGGCGGSKQDDSSGMLHTESAFFPFKTLCLSGNKGRHTNITTQMLESFGIFVQSLTEVESFSLDWPGQPRLAWSTAQRSVWQDWST